MIALQQNNHSNQPTTMVNNQSNAEDHDDLRIVEYLNLATLPEPLQQMLSQASTPAERDMLLMARRGISYQTITWHVQKNQLTLLTL